MRRTPRTTANRTELHSARPGLQTAPLPTERPASLGLVHLLQKNVQQIERFAGSLAHCVWPRAATAMGPQVWLWGCWAAGLGQGQASGAQERHEGTSPWLFLSPFLSEIKGNQIGICCSSEHPSHSLVGGAWLGAVPYLLLGFCQEKGREGNCLHFQTKPGQWGACWPQAPLALVQPSLLVR